ncbi:MAG: D-alanyl-D-alanine carboxypeptidase [Defluviitaleaceae bacterium]|nr:D-alanyl-D-alanine carboxypeptidase [Defluviitaleaceae bacterium]MCL2238630.1 D-alanyl-D-alanine carboxypeptidase [Defluviitaleaceae bacterium]
MKTLQLFALAALLTTATIEEGYTGAPEPPPYRSGGVVIMCANTGMVLYGHEYHTEFYPASITKVMTALVVLDHVQDLSERVPFSHHAVYSIPRNSSHIAMNASETLSVYEALHALMLRSANEVSIALAEYVAGSEEEFVSLMNHRAASIGAVHTHFANSTGLPATGHITTAYDMALIMRETVRLYPVFGEIIATARFDIPPTERQPEVRALLTTNQLIRQGPYFNPRVVGSKTGWTHAAGNTLVTYASYEGRRLIVTILQGAGSDPFRETTALLNFGFALPYEERVVFNAGSYIRIVPVYQEIDAQRVEIYRLVLQAEDNLVASLPANFDLTRLRYYLTVTENIDAPVMEGDRLGSVAIYAQSVRLGTVPLLAQSTVEKLPPPQAQSTVAQLPVPVPYLPAYLYDPYAGAYYPLPDGGLFAIFREGEQLSALAVPLTVAFFGLIFAVLALATRRKRRERQIISRYSSLYRYRP